MVPAYRSVLVELHNLLVDQLVSVLTLVLGPAGMHQHPISNDLPVVQWICGLCCPRGRLQGRCRPVGFGSGARVDLLFPGGIGLALNSLGLNVITVGGVQSPVLPLIFVFTSIFAFLVSRQTVLVPGFFRSSQ